MDIRRMMRAGRAGMIALAMGSADAGAAAIGYNTPGTTPDRQLASLDSGGVTATGSDTLTVGYHGLNVLGGIVGPYSDGTTDPSESLAFRFDAGPATGIVVSLGGTGTYGDYPVSRGGEAFLTAFDGSGRPLGTLDFVPFANGVETFRFDVSGAFGGEPISSFLIRPAGDQQAGAFLQVYGLAFTPSVPEPSTLAVFAMAATIPAFRRLAGRPRR